MNSRNGFSLIEAVIALAIFSLVIVLVMKSSGDTTKKMATLSEISNISDLFREVDEMAQSRKVITASINRSQTQPAGDVLKNIYLCATKNGAVDCTMGTSSTFWTSVSNCIRDDASTDCAALASKQFELFDGSKVWAGPKSAPVRYRSNGSFCDPGEVASFNCPFEAFAFFQPTCASCDRANNLNIIVAVRKAPTLGTKEGSLKVSERISSLLTVGINSVAAPITSCVGQVIKGYDDSGNAICETPPVINCGGNGKYLQSIDFVNHTGSCVNYAFNDCGTNMTSTGLNSNGSSNCGATVPRWNTCCGASSQPGCTAGDIQIGNNSDGSPQCSVLKTMIRGLMQPYRRCVAYFTSAGVSQPTQPGQPAQPAQPAGRTCQTCNACNACANCNGFYNTQDIYVTENTSSCENAGDLDQGTLFYAFPKTF